MKTVDVLMKMPKIEGYEYTGEWRSVEPGEASVYNGEVRVWSFRSSGEYPVLRKVENWKPLHSGQACYFGENQKQIKLKIWNVDHSIYTVVEGKIVDIVFYGGGKAPNNHISIKFQPIIGSIFMAHLDYVEYLED